MFSVVTLGCGSAKPSLHHNPSSTIVNIRGNLFMIDCGEGCQLEMQRQHIKFPRLNHILLTHLHGDHCFGLPGLISTLGLLGKQGDIHIHTFADGIDFFSRTFRFFYPETPFKIVFHEIKKEEAVVYEDSAITIRTILLRHRLPTVGYVIEEKPKLRHIIREMIDYYKVPIAQIKDIKAGKPFINNDGNIIPAEILTRPASPSLSYAHIGDTSFMPEIASKIGPVDLLYHETTYLSTDTELAYKRGHSTAAQAAEMANLCGAKMLLTGHYSSRYHNDKLFLQEAISIFPNSILNREGLGIKL